LQERVFPQPVKPGSKRVGNRIREGWSLDEPGGAGLKPGATIKESFWVNIIGRGYPPPSRVFRWCTQRMKIDPVDHFVKQRVGHWGEAILHLGARRAQTMAARQTRYGLRGILTCRASGYHAYSRSLSR